jgi:hypothetical protein
MRIERLLYVCAGMERLVIGQGESQPTIPWNKLKVGDCHKISAIREATLAKELHDAGAEVIDSLYMGMCINVPN